MTTALPHRDTVADQPGEEDIPQYRFMHYITTLHLLHMEHSSQNQNIKYQRVIYHDLRKYICFFSSTAEADSLPQVAVIRDQVNG